MHFGSVTQDDIYAADETPINGINAWASRGIAGRGVLIDYFSWAQEKGIKYDPTKTHPITLGEIKMIISEKNITLRKGDIFFLRTGMYSPPSGRLTCWALLKLILTATSRVCVWLWIAGPANQGRTQDRTQLARICAIRGVGQVALGKSIRCGRR